MVDPDPEVTVMTELVRPTHSNHHGTLFAGEALSMMASAAFTAASRHAREKVVLAAVQDMRFYEPIPVGSLFSVEARVIDAGRSSMMVAVTGRRENPETGDAATVAQGQFQMVAVNQDGRPKKFTSREIIT